MCFLRRKRLGGSVESGGGSSDGNTIWGYLLGAPDDGSGSVHAARRTGVPTVQRSWQAEGLRGHEIEHATLVLLVSSGAAIPDGLHREFGAAALRVFKSKKWVGVC